MCCQLRQESPANKLAACSTVPSENLTVPQVVKKFTAFYKTNVHYRVHNSPTLVPILNQTVPANNFSSYFFA